MAELASKFNIGCVIHYYSDQWSQFANCASNFWICDMKFCFLRFEKCRSQSLNVWKFRSLSLVEAFISDSCKFDLNTATVIVQLFPVFISFLQLKVLAVCTNNCYKSAVNTQNSKCKEISCLLVVVCFFPEVGGAYIYVQSKLVIFSASITQHDKHKIWICFCESTFSLKPCIFYFFYQKGWNILSTTKEPWYYQLQWLFISWNVCQIS